MVRRFISRQNLSLLPLSLFILTSGLNAGQIKAQMVDEDWELGRGKEESVASNERRSANRDTRQGLKSLSYSESPLKWTQENSGELVVSPLKKTLAVSWGINSPATEGVGREVEGKSGESQVGKTPLVNPESELLAPRIQGGWGELPKIAQIPNFQPDRTPPPSQAPFQPQTPAPLPPPEQLLQSPSSIPPTPEPIPGKVPESIVVERFEFEGNTAISNADLAAVTETFTKRRITFAELFQARAAVTKLYIDRGYITSGALIPPQKLQDGVIKIQVVEGGLESINVVGTRRLHPDYVRSRLAIATEKPLNRDRLLEALQLLQLNPLIRNISAELAAGTQPGLNLLEVQISEAKTFNTQIGLDNNRAPSIGSFRRRVQVNQANLTGVGDALNLGYSNTVGSNGIDLSYTRPINPRNGTLKFSYGLTTSNVVEPPFNRIDIAANSRYYELTYRQPLLQTPSQEFAIGLTATRQESDTSVLEIPFPLSPGADDRGRTRISALRFFQEWTKRNSREVIAARSQFSLGLGIFNSTINNDAPDSRFFSWRGQAQWVRLLAPDTLFLLRTDVQLADRTLVPLEQFGLGGQESVRGYRQDLLLTDNGALVSAEVRFPLARISKWNAIIQLAPFLDFGSAWSSSGKQNPDPNILASVGLGLQMQIGDRLSLRLDYGIPFVSVTSRKRTWQENGLYFSIVATPF